jgi:hypothetical protein
VTSAVISDVAASVTSAVAASVASAAADVAATVAASVGLTVAGAIVGVAVAEGLQPINASSARHAAIMNIIFDFEPTMMFLHGNIESQAALIFEEHADYMKRGWA